MSAKIEPGLEVGAERWPYAGAHPDCWGRPHRGVVLDQTDPRAWSGSIAFPREPGRGEVLEHLIKVGWSEDEVPVAWEFGRVYWERVENLKPYDEDVRAWERAREERRNGQA